MAEIKRNVRVGMKKVPISEFADDLADTPVHKLERLLRERYESKAENSKPFS